MHLPQTHSQLAAMLSCDKSHLKLNPIYRIAGRQTHARIQLQWPSARMQEECGAVLDYMPAELELEKAAWKPGRNGALPAAGDAAVQEMVKSFVLVPLPRGYHES